MNERPCRLLLLDFDQGILLTLQHLLEDAGFDTTITWDETEARQLLKNKFFDLVLLGDHPPEIRAETILRDSSLEGGCYACLMVPQRAPQADIEHLRDVGVISVVTKGDSLGVLEEAQKHWCLQGRKSA
jgi:DNA-binding response OmpR family regulator